LNFYEQKEKKNELRLARADNKIKCLSEGPHSVAGNSAGRPKQKESHNNIL